MSEEPIAAGIDPAKGESETVWNIFLDGEIVGQAKTEEQARMLSRLYQFKHDIEGLSDRSKENFSGLYNARDWDARISVPYHCLLRMLNALAFCDIVTSGSALERDCLLVKQIVNDDLKKNNNIQK